MTAEALDRTTDIDGRAYAKLSAVKPGDHLQCDGGFTCLKDGAIRMVKRHVVGRDLYIDCADGGHTLDGQADDGEHLVGLYPVADPRK